MISPLTRKRLRAFRSNRRAWWSLLALGGVFLFSMCAELVCPCDPRAVVDAKTLEKYRQPIVERTYDIQAVRFSVDAKTGEAFDCEGRDAAPGKGEIAAMKDGGECELRGTRYRVSVRDRGDYVRCFLEPVEPARASERKVGEGEIEFPFRPCREHPFGIDAGGRDVYARVVHGLRIALVFGLVLALSGMAVGVVFGAVQGYFAGCTDIVLQRFTEVWSAMPFIYVMIFIGSTVGRGFAVLLVCYALFNWIAVSYYMRAEFLRLRGATFVEAAKVMGVSRLKIIFTHILPNALTPLITLFPFLLMGAIGSLAALDFLGFGLPPMTPSCGELMQEAQQFRHAWWLIFFPAAALFLVMLLTVLVGEGLRDAFDPREKSRIE